LKAAIEKPGQPPICDPSAAGSLDFDIMLEIKDKEKSALRARQKKVKMKRIPELPGIFRKSGGHHG
jgi:hypothetical protein